MSNIPTSIGRYEILGSIGRGGMGSLFLALDPLLDRQLAIKLLRDDDDDLRERFAREARAAARLRHPNIVTIFDVGDHEGQPFIAMEYIQGQTLAEVVRGNVAMPLVRKLELIEALCDGLGFAHKSGIIHRDVKPANLMIDADGSLKILDFGIARASESSGMTQAGMLIGTLNYMSPEQVSGQAVDLRSDLFAVGAVFYELLAYRQAFPGGLMAGILNKILTGKPEPLASVVPGIDPEIVRIIDRALEKDPDHRYPDLPAMRQDIVLARARLAATEPTRVLGAQPSADDSGETRFTPPPSTPSRRSANLENLAKRRTEQVQRHVSEAEAKLGDGDVDAAIASAEQALLLDPHHAAAHGIIDRARAAIEARQVEEALEAASGGIASGDFAAATAFLDRAAGIDPRAPRLAEMRRSLDEAVQREEEVRQREQLEQRAREVVADADARFADGRRDDAVATLAAFRPSHPAVAQALERLRAEAARLAEEERAAAERAEQEAAEQRRREEEARVAREREQAAADAMREAQRAADPAAALAILRPALERDAANIELQRAEARAAEEAQRHAEKAERERAARERAERERAERERAEQAERERVAREKAERERLERERAERDAREKAEKAARERAERERAEKEAAEKAARQRADEQKAARARAEKEAAEKAARDKAARDQADREKAAAVAASADADADDRTVVIFKRDLPDQTIAMPASVGKPAEPGTVEPASSVPAPAAEGRSSAPPVPPPAPPAQPAKAKEAKTGEQKKPAQADRSPKQDKTAAAALPPPPPSRLDDVLVRDKAHESPAGGGISNAVKFGGAAAAVLLAVLGFVVFGGGDSTPDPSSSESAATSEGVDASLAPVSDGAAGAETPDTIAPESTEPGTAATNAAAPTTTVPPTQAATPQTQAPPQRPAGPSAQDQQLDNLLADAQRLRSGGDLRTALERVEAALKVRANDSRFTDLADDIRQDAERRMAAARGQAQTVGAPATSQTAFREGDDLAGQARQHAGAGRDIDAARTAMAAEARFAAAAAEGRRVVAAADDARRQAEAQAAQQAADAKANAAAARANDEKAILAVVEQYRQAFNNLDANAVARVFPSGAPADLRAAWERLERQNVTFSNVSVNLDAAATAATVNASARTVVKPRGAAEQNINAPMVLTLRKNGNNWVITARK